LKIKITFYFFLILLFVGAYINFNVFNSYIAQRKILSNFNSNKYEEIVFEKFKRINLNFPNLNVTAMPMKELLARYYHIFGDSQKALSLLNNGKSANPNWHLNEYFKSIIFYDLKVKDSATHFAREAFYKLPGNIAHYEMYMKTLRRNNNVNELIKAFKYARKKRPFHYKAFLANTYGLDYDFQSKIFIDSIVKISRYFNDDEIQNLVDFHLYGKENSLEAFKNLKIADNYFKEKNHVESIKYYQKAINLNPDILSAYENILVQKLIIKNVTQQDVDLSNKLIELREKYNSLTGKEYFVKANLLFELDKVVNKKSICDLIQLSVNLGYKPSLKFKIEFCN